MVKLVLVRHGESIANKDNVYTGWNDVPLTNKGKHQAAMAGKLLNEEKIVFNAVHTSVLERAIVTANIIVENCHQLWIPIYKTWRLNERHYGALRGLNKDYTRQVYGKKQVALWRRSFYAIPPYLEKTDQDRRYALIDPKSLPRAESLAMSLTRILPYWQDEIVPQLLQGKNQLVVAHGSTIRAIIKYLEKISDTDINGVEVENSEPIIYTLDDSLNILSKEIIIKKSI
ncbi:2,3-bisphosphoglycerate-dependent phosphoglycerate mutase [Ligilactobacillus sp. WILCCON 0076]|uniref:2,3-bisphosphoglycerate-dependent phosphoglycerate mutase n=1 Tax=Ligilactobacillus ubinensis TaxID=2876789 RepID=A0A9X2FLL1_9LACO|nr:2,3-bisphosphoglycerate-dependent phosphoglycerate mutase [Ligilactobacillus ubinensis]MCP0887515.1 2,3-bisphosphoglycerate-dependent phosphoglycerate mutase [Ligilactobacillus ubinensis]